MATETLGNEVTDLETAQQKLARLRDELRLHLHLMSADARDEWHRLERRWPELERAVDAVGTTAGAVEEDVRLGAGRLVEELSAGYARVRRIL